MTLGGVWKDSASEKVRESINPANIEDVVGTVPDSTPSDVDEAVEAARKAYKSWRLVPAPKRGEILYRAAELLLKNKEELGRLATREMGTSWPERAEGLQARQSRRSLPAKTVNPYVNLSASLHSSPRGTSRPLSPHGNSCQLS